MLKNEFKDVVLIGWFISIMFGGIAYGNTVSDLTYLLI